MKKRKIYYHVLEEGHYGNVGHQGYYDTLEEAEKEIKRLNGYFPNNFFYVFTSNSYKEPEVVTI
jgi:hypothetical protein